MRAVWSKLGIGPEPRQSGGTQRCKVKKKSELKASQEDSDQKFQQPAGLPIKTLWQILLAPSHICLTLIVLQVLSSSCSRCIQLWGNPAHSSKLCLRQHLQLKKEMPYVLTLRPGSILAPQLVRKYRAELPTHTGMMAGKENFITSYHRGHLEAHFFVPAHSPIKVSLQHWNCSPDHACRAFQVVTRHSLHPEIRSLR